MKKIITIVLLLLNLEMLYSDDNKTVVPQDRAGLLAYLKENPEVFFDINSTLKKDKKFILSLVEYIHYFEIDEKLQVDKEVVFAFVKNTPYIWENLDEKLKTNKFFVLSILKETGYGLKNLSKKHKSDKKLVLEAIKKNASAFKFVDKKLRKDKNFIKEALTMNGQVLEFLNKQMRANRVLVLLALKEDGTALEYVSNMLSSDEEIVREAIKESSWAFSYAHRYLKQDRKFVLKLLNEGHLIVDWIDKTLQKDEELLKIALKHDGAALNYLDENLTNDRAFVLKAIKNNGDALYYTHEKFKKDKELVAIAVQKNIYSLNYADKVLREDKKFLFSLIKKDIKVVTEIDKKLWKDNAFLLKVLKYTGYGLKYASEKQKNDKKLVLKAIKYDSYQLEYASSECKKDKKLVLQAIDEYAFTFKFADKSLQEDREFLKKALKVNGHVLAYGSDKFKEDRELALLAITEGGAYLESLSSTFQKEKKMVHLAVLSDASSFRYAAESLREDEGFIDELIDADINVLPYVAKHLINDESLLKLTKNIPHKYESLERLLLYVFAFFLLLFLYSKIIREMKKSNYFLLIAILAFSLAVVLKTYFIHGVFREPYVLIDESNKFGLEPIKCWMTSNEKLSQLECYNMHVPEIYADEKSRVITFPVRVFRSSKMFSSESPILHLGGGGPGAEMQLDKDYALEAHLEKYAGFSVNQGRDLFIIDPRGAGLSIPLLTCRTYVDNFLTNMRKNLTLAEQWKVSESDYAECIRNFKKEKIDFNGYNSFAVADDMNLLSKSVGIEKWILFGVSYSTTYSMIAAKKYPNRVESMILDSACFPNLKLDHNSNVQTMDSYNALYNYKDNIKEKVVTKNMDVKSRMWALHKKLNKEPIKVAYLDLKIDGNYFVNSLLKGVYGTKIFKELPKIILEMERNVTKKFLPYFKSEIEYQMDRTYGDVSSMAHYCYEDKPFIDFQKIKSENSKLPEGYIKYYASLVFEFNDFCKEMDINSTDKTLADSIITEVPTIFIHGEFDPVTPLRDVRTEMKGFKNSKLLIYKTSHAVLSADENAKNDVAQFLLDLKRE